MAMTFFYYIISLDNSQRLNFTTRRLSTRSTLETEERDKSRSKRCRVNTATQHPTHLYNITVTQQSATFTQHRQTTVDSSIQHRVDTTLQQSTYLYNTGSPPYNNRLNYTTVTINVQMEY